MFRSRALWVLLAIGLTLRIVYGWTQDPLVPYGQTGGDDPWYLANALALVTDAPPGTVINGYPVDVSKLNQPPVFFVVAGFAQAALPPGPAVQALRILQAIATTAVALFGCGLAVRLVGGIPRGSDRLARRAGLLAAAALALSPVLIVESSLVKTESMFLFFLVGGVWAYVEAIARAKTTPGHSSLASGAEQSLQADAVQQRQIGERVSRPHVIGWFALAGVLLGLATLTRAVFLAFPLALVVFTLFALGWRPGWKKSLLLFAVYAVVVLSWTAYNLARYQRLVIAGEGFASFIYLGAAGWDGFAAVDQRLDATLGPSTDGSRDSGEFLQAAGSTIGANLPAYLTRRLSELGGALLQPHNVELFLGPSLRRMLNEWWQSDRSAVGLVSVAGGSSFWPKLLLYVVHYTGLVLGLVGVALTWRAWRAGLPMLGYIGYVLLIHLVLLALPRYVFPITPFVWVFAAAGIAIVSAELKAKRESASVE